MTRGTSFCPSFFYLLLKQSLICLYLYYMERIELEKETITEIIRLYNDEMMGSPSISEKLGIKKHIILRVLKENNIVVGVPGQKFKGGKSKSDKRWYEKNKEKRLNYFSTWQKNNSEYRKKYMEEYRKQNKEKIKEVKRNYQKEKRHTDPIYKLISNFRTAIYTVLKEHDLGKYTNYFKMIGYLPQDLRTHLEKQFTNGMSWENYGKWHVDHIKPISSFTFNSSEDEEFKECWSLDNLQPMWGIENIKKSNKIL